tara:strand:- start:155 stop:778 length:624 start_codon:yes stop_codon:yes gene_type:complete
MTVSYEEHPAFPVRFFKFRASKELTSTTLAEVKKLQFTKRNEPDGVGTSGAIQNRKEFLPIHKWFQDCIDSIHKNERWHTDRLVVNKSWANRSDANTGDSHGYHRHPMSYLSGVFYLTKGAPTVFLDPVKDRDWGQFHLDGYPDKDCKLFTHLGVGGLIVFPSYVIHGSDSNYDVDRFTIAFNTFPQGEFGGHYGCDVTVNDCGDYL